MHDKLYSSALQTESAPFTQFCTTRKGYVLVVIILFIFRLWERDSYLVPSDVEDKLNLSKLWPHPIFVLCKSKAGQNRPGRCFSRVFLSRAKPNTCFAYRLDQNKLYSVCL